MRFICIPGELAPLYLLELRDVPQLLRDMLDNQARQHILAGQFEAALSFVERVFSISWSKGDRHTAALALLYKADLFRSLLRWEEALEACSRASDWLRMVVTPTARYNEAIAAYLEGILHFALRADIKATQSFVLALELLGASGYYWNFEGYDKRVIDCQHLSQWITDIQDSQELPPDEFFVLVPVYELDNSHFARKDLIPIYPARISMPIEALCDDVESGNVPLNIDSLSLFEFRPQANYLIFRALLDGQWVKESRAGDMLLVEVISPAFLVNEIVLTTDRPFVRRGDGRVLSRPVKAPGDSEWVPRVIPRVLIRQDLEDGI
ncbi:MAG: hypothetical protein JW981_02000 [Anaerolineae bacterium]|nr:hypothetical protein [Anaerolineae bacterium]